MSFWTLEWTSAHIWACAVTNPPATCFSLFHRVIPYFKFGIHYSSFLYIYELQFQYHDYIFLNFCYLLLQLLHPLHFFFYLLKFTQSLISVKILMVPSMKWQQCIQLHLVERSLHNSNSVITCLSADISDFQKSLFDLPFFGGWKSLSVWKSDVLLGIFSCSTIVQ